MSVTGHTPDDPSRIASDPSRSAWVAANAGAGKTYTLANRVTRLLLERVPPQKILCLTYTKAAAAEMSERLFRQLGEWSMLSDTELTDRIVGIGGTTRNAADLRQARRLFAEALETPGGLKIQTIHAFCQHLLSAFPLEAGVSPFFRVMEDQTAREMMQEARIHVLERAADGDATRAAAISYLVMHTSEGRFQQVLDTALSGDRRKTARFLRTFGEHERSAALRVAHGAQADDTPERIARSFCEGLRPKYETLAAIAAWLASAGPKDAPRGTAIGRVVAGGFAPDGFDILRAVLLKKDGERITKLAPVGHARSRPDLLAALEILADDFCAAHVRYKAAHAASLAEAAMIVIDAVHRKYDTAKARAGLLDYDDLIERSLSLLNRPGAGQWVLFKLDRGIDHLLIDEAQDTSPQQWEIVRKLTEEFFAGEGQRPSVRSRTIFAVGDEKQSVFSFQGADPALFDHNRLHFRDAAMGADAVFSEVQLPTSRRSVPQVLSFVDAVFASDAARDGLTSAGATVTHRPLRVADVGRVEIWETEKPSPRPEPDPWRPTDVESRISPVVQLAEKIAARIRKWLDDGMTLPSRDKPVTPGDIMILLPRREPFGSEIIRQLKLRGIPVAGADRMRLTDQIAVKDLIALGRFVLLPEDDLNLAALLRSPLVRLSEDALFQLAHERAGTLWEALKHAANRYADAVAFLSEMLSGADFQPPYEFYAEALIRRGLRGVMIARLGPETGDAMDEFLSLAFAYERGNTPSLEGFLAWFERGGAEIKRDMERARNEVRVMTVHGAKGLEADIVFLPHTTSLPDAGSQRGHLLYAGDGILFPVPKARETPSIANAKQAAQDAAMREYRRLFYVALTRARDLLVVAGFENSRGVDPRSWYALARAAQEPSTDDAFYARRAAPVSAAMSMQETAIPAWAMQAPAPEPPTRLLHPSDASDEETPPVARAFDPGARFKRGQLAHTLLAHLPDIAVDAREAIAMRFLAARGMDENGARALAHEVMAVLDDPAFAAAFAPGSRAEVALTAELPEIGPRCRVQGRVDRLAITDDAVLIVDFKTNRPPPASEAEVTPLYMAQMALYRAAAQRIFPGRRIGCALVWTSGPRLMPLSDGLMDAQIGRIRARLDPAGGRS